MRKIIFLTALLMPPVTHAATHFACSYSFQNVPMATVDFDQADNGQLSPRAKITMGNAPQPHEESFTAEPIKKSDVRIHAWISKESAENQIEFILYNEKKSAGNSEIINHNVPYFQEVWGDCK